MFAQSSSDFLYSRKDHERVRNLLKVQTAFMTMIGQRPYVIEEWFPPSLQGGRFLSCLYSGFVVMQTMHTSILFARTTVDKLKEGELSDSSDALTQVIIFSFSWFLTCYWLWNMKTLRKYIDFINYNYNHSLVGVTYVSSFDSYLKARRITIFWVSAGIFGSIFFGIAPLLQRSHSLPLNCWYPFDPLQPWLYPFLYVLQMFTQINIGFTFTCGSALYVSLIVLMCGQYDVLFFSLKNLKYHTQLLCGENLNELRAHQEQLPSSIDDEVNQYMFSKEQLTDLKVFRQMPENLVSPKPYFQAVLHESIVKCVQLHQFICECCKILESLYHPYCLVKSLQITFQLCLLVFVGVADDISAMRVFNLFQYLVFTLIDLMFFTFCGELLRQHSVRAGEAFWRSDWPSYATAIRKEILIFLINSKRPIKLTAGKFFIMDIDRLRSVVMQASSFLTLLQKLSDKKSNGMECITFKNIYKKNQQSVKTNT